MFKGQCRFSAPAMNLIGIYEGAIRTLDEIPRISGSTAGYIVQEQQNTSLDLRAIDKNAIVGGKRVHLHSRLPALVLV